MSENEGVESQEIREAVERIGSRVAWLDVYQIYLVIAVALNVIGLLRYGPRVFYGFVNGIDFDTVFYFVLSLASIALYAFALNSLRRLNEPWVHKLHLAINGAAVLSGLLWLLPMGSDAIRYLASIVGVASFSLGAILPRDPTALAGFLQAFAPGLVDYFSSGVGLYQMYRVANIIALVLASVWAVHWLRYSSTHKMAMPVKAGVDATAADSLTYVSEEPQASDTATRVIGWLLRFGGMFVLVPAVGFTLVMMVFDSNDVGVPVLLAALGAAMHYAGRKMAPGKKGASASGVIAGLIGVVVVILFIVGFIIALLKYISG